MEVPLGPHDTLHIQNRVRHLPFGQATSTWPGRFIRERAREVLAESVERHLRAMGWEVKGEELVPTGESGHKPVDVAMTSRGR